MKFIKKIIKLSVIFTLVLSFSNISSSSEKNYYKDLITDWSRIFPDKNIKVQVKWTNGKTETISVKKLNKTITLNQSN